MQNFRTLGLIIKKVRNLFNLPDKYGKIIQCVHLVICWDGVLLEKVRVVPVDEMSVIKCNNTMS